MKTSRPARFAQVALVLVTMAAWFVASDHCALASALTRPVVQAPSQEHCPGHSQPEKKNDQGKLPCCKSLVAMPASGKIYAAYDFSLFLVQSYFAADFQLLLKHLASPLIEFDTGPPGGKTFAESVLQRSLLAHAPPRLS